MEKYQILHLLQEDHLGKQFVALNRQTDQKVMLKVILPPEGKMAEWVQQYQQENYLLSQIQHPNVTKSYDFFIKDQYICIATEYIEGFSLAQFLPNVRKYTFCEQIEMAIQITSSVIAVNEFGITHQNVFPRNFIVRKSDNRIKLTDIGMIGPRTWEINTPNVEYVSPERLSGCVVANSDVYSLGALLYIFFGYALEPNNINVFVQNLRNYNLVKIPVNFQNSEAQQKLSLTIQSALAKNAEQRTKNASLVKKQLKEVYKQASSSGAKISKTVKKRLTAPIEPRLNDTLALSYKRSTISSNKQRKKNLKRLSFIFTAIFLVVILSLVLVNRHVEAQKIEEKKQAYSLFSKALQLANNTEYQEAIKVNEQAIKVLPMSEFLALKAFFVFLCRENEDDFMLANKIATQVVPRLQKKNTVDANYLLGFLYTEGIGVEKNLDTALEYFQKNSNHCYSLQEQARIYNLKKDYTRAAQILEKGVAEKDPMCMVQLAYLHIEKKLTLVDLIQAEVLLRRAADLKCGAAMNALGFFYFTNNPPDYKKGIEWFEKGVENNYSTSYYNLGKLSLHGKYVPLNVDKGISYLEKAVKNSHYQGAIELGRAYLQGKVVGQDYNKAFLWFQHAAYRENHEAMFFLASMYIKGYGVKKNPEIALTYYIKSAEKNNVNAMYDLALLYSVGKDVALDMPKALQFARKGAELGDAGCMYLLGFFAEKGVIRPTNITREKFVLTWYEKAASLGEPRAKKALKRMRKKH